MIFPISLATRRHNRHASQPHWWRRCFWSQDVYWARFAVYKAVQRARMSRCSGDGRYLFWSRVAAHATAYCQQHDDPVPGALLQRLVEHERLASPEVARWLRAVEPPYRRQRSLTAQNQT